MSTDRAQIRSYVELETKQAFTEICKKENRSESNMVEYLIKKFIAEYEQQESRAEQKSELERSSISRTG